MIIIIVLLVVPVCGYCVMVIISGSVWVSLRVCTLLACFYRTVSWLISMQMKMVLVVPALPFLTLISVLCALMKMEKTAIAIKIETARSFERRRRLSVSSFSVALLVVTVSIYLFVFVVVVCQLPISQHNFAAINWRVTWWWWWWWS